MRGVTRSICLTHLRRTHQTQHTSHRHDVPLTTLDHRRQKRLDGPIMREDIDAIGPLNVLRSQVEDEFSGNDAGVVDDGRGVADLFHIKVKGQ